MSFINCGALIDGLRPLTKKELREAVAAYPDSVSFDATSIIIQPAEGGYGTPQASLDAVREGHKLSVVGPDPFTNRRWYATVEMGKNGIKVS